MVMHLDQCLFPILAVLCALAFAVALERTSWLFAGLAGVAFYICSFISFSLIPLLLLLGLQSVFAGVKAFAEHSDTPVERGYPALWNPARLWTCFAVGLLGMHLLFWLVWM